ncbi:glutaredoxin 3 [Terasakiella sp. A23]|uniref:glutaredoxin 3 n=1 Tax=Terasakiella sp. FCG-A23 TaxID=3080561 RepID=UPI0029546B42|nr:glutaredoxin 3 [Terasakiella sp. A23]MDV7340069.1 glutaredoxin 3 [Terasakiella sp. A23]
MANIEIYTSQFCGYCMRAKMLLQDKGAGFKEIDVNKHPEARREMTERANGGYTVPQIFINGEHIGGCDELYALERAGKLDEKLAA